ncbi:hypothetical protein [Streptomyces sp. NPDC002088]|uniref:hypothetical protein n=1 Tax=Streptomyces sp. NPDC002088 TaxID=3154665 RepID=UPI003322EE30
MRERPVVVDESSAGEEAGKRKRIDLSVPQVAGSAVAAVVAAKLASYFGVYGTILGAGVVSVVATCGGTLFQHFFKRTGEQIREVTVPSKSAVMVPQVEAPPPVGEFTEGTVYRARVRSWKRPLVAAALVFGVTMAGITTYELASGNSFSGGSTTVGDALSGHDKSSSGSGSGGSGSGGDSPSSTSSATPEATDGATPSSGASSGDTGNGGTTRNPAPAPSTTDSEGSGDGSSTPAGTPSASATSPEPSASSRSGTAVPDQAGPSAR